VDAYRESIHALSDLSLRIGDEIYRNTVKTLSHAEDLPYWERYGLANDAAGPARLLGRGLWVISALMDVVDVGAETANHGPEAGIRKGAIVITSTVVGGAVTTACVGSSLGIGTPACVLLGAGAGGLTDWALENIVPKPYDTNGAGGGF
jgi:hypothetical protein